MKRFIIYLLLTVLATAAWAQKSEVRKLLRGGNREYRKEHYDEATTRYRKALSSDSTSIAGQYNLGNSLYRKGQKGNSVEKAPSFDEAAKHYSAAIANPKISDKQRSRAYHNRGNCRVQQGKADQEKAQELFGQAVQDYQEALKLDPKNEDTKYNLSLAKKLLRQQQQQNQGGGGNNDKNQDKKDQQQQQQQQQQNQDNQKQDKQQQQQQPQPQQSEQKKDAERLLKAMENSEKKTMKEQQLKAEKSSRRIEKDW